ncbi:hypothetical protein, partial [Enterococcus faecium]
RPRSCLFRHHHNNALDPVPVAVFLNHPGLTPGEPAAVWPHILAIGLALGAGDSAFVWPCQQMLDLVYRKPRLRSEKRNSKLLPRT